MKTQVKTTKRGNNRGGRAAEQEAAIKRVFNDLPVVEAKADIRVAILTRDTRGATKGDPTNCLLARACKRQFGSANALFFRRTAYIEIPDENNVRRVERFMVPEDAYDVLSGFDVDGKIRTGGFVLRAPRPSERLDAQTRYQAERNRALLNGERFIDPVRSAAAKKSRSNRKALRLQAALRDGHGMVHFVTKEPATV
jgi:hypothetical protein